MASWRGSTWFSFLAVREGGRVDGSLVPEKLGAVAVAGAPRAGSRVAPQWGGGDVEWEGGPQGNGLEKRMRNAQVRRKFREEGIEMS